MHVVSLGSIWNEELAPLLDRGLTFAVADPDDAQRRDAMLAMADVLVSGRFTADMGRVCKRLRLLVCPAAGTEFIDRAALPPGALVVNGSGHELTMAEYAIGCLIALRQHLFESDAAMRRGEWRYGFYGGVVEELYGSNLGMVGFGRIGHEIATRAAAFGMRCAAVTLHPGRPRAGSTDLEFLGGLEVASDVDRLVGWADELVLCCELSPLTRGLLDARRFGLMKSSALLVNVARGPVAVEQDLYDALASKRIAGAAIDVWYQYPDRPGEKRLPSKLPFHELDNVIMSPHASGWSDASKRRRVAAIAKAINDFARGG